MPVAGLDPGVVAGFNGSFCESSAKKGRGWPGPGHDSEINGFNTSGNRVSWMHELPRLNRIRDQPIEASVARAMICQARDRCAERLRGGEPKSAPPSLQC
jgi:hypothetical protein